MLAKCYRDGRKNGESFWSEEQVLMYSDLYYGHLHFLFFWDVLVTQGGVSVILAEKARNSL